MVQAGSGRVEPLRSHDNLSYNPSLSIALRFEPRTNDKSLYIYFCRAVFVCSQNSSRSVRAIDVKLGLIMGHHTGSVIRL